MLYIAAFLIALISVSWIHPRLVKIALDKNIVDNPNARKLQRKPVPVLGGIAVFSDQSSVWVVPASVATVPSCSSSSWR